MPGDEKEQVSEVQRLDEDAADTPVSDDQAVAGQPVGESGDVQEGPTGPDAPALDAPHDREGDEKE
jgi:hypothetical protein